MAKKGKQPDNGQNGPNGPNGIPDFEPPSLFDFFDSIPKASAPAAPEQAQTAAGADAAEQSANPGEDNSSAEKNDAPAEAAPAAPAEKQAETADKAEPAGETASSDEAAPAAPAAPEAPPPPPPAPVNRRLGGEGPMRELINGNFLQFASYTICNRAIPTVEDGLKPVQRRIMHALWEADDGRFTKVASIVGDTMHYHPHGDASIYEAIVNLVNMRYLIEGQGNYGNLFTGDPAAAPRYIECRLTELARKEVFNPKITEYVPSYDGRSKEPLLLPSKLPLLLLMGAKGIAVGLSTEIFPHNFNELIQAQIDIIQKKPVTLYPDFQTGGLIDATEYADGAGKIKIRADIEARDKNKVVITSLPWGQTTESLIDSIEDAIKKKKVLVRDITDLTAEKVEIELTLSTGATQEKTIQSLYAFTNCETSLSCRPVVLFNNRPCEMKVTDILRANTDMLLDILHRELEVRAGELDKAFHAKTLEQIFIEERIYKLIEEQETYEAVQQAVLDGFVPFRPRLRRDVTLDDVEQLLQIRIRRISRFDIEKNRQEIEDILREEAEVADNLAHLRAYATRYLKGLMKTYGKKFPRLSRIADAPFAAIEVRSLTATELTIYHDAANGYIGSAVRGGTELFKCSSLDKLLVVMDDGSYKMIPPPDKYFVEQKMVECRIFNRETLFTAVYSEPKYGFSYLKRFSFGGCIQNKEYRLAPEKSKLILFVEGTPEKLYVKYKPAKAQRVNQQVFDPSETDVKGVSAKGKQLTSKPIAKITTERPRGWDDNTQKGLLL